MLHSNRPSHMRTCTVTELLLIAFVGWLKFMCGKETWREISIPFVTDVVLCFLLSSWPTIRGQWGKQEKKRNPPFSPCTPPPPRPLPWSYHACLHLHHTTTTKTAVSVLRSLVKGENSFENNAQHLQEEWKRLLCHQDDLSQAAFRFVKADCRRCCGNGDQHTYHADGRQFTIPDLAQPSSFQTCLPPLQSIWSTSTSKHV